MEASVNLPHPQLPTGTTDWLKWKILERTPLTNHRCTSTCFCVLGNGCIFHNIRLNTAGRGVRECDCHFLWNSYPNHFFKSFFFFVQNLKGTEQYVSRGLFVSEGARLHILFMSFWRRWKAACIIGWKQTCLVMVLDKMAVDLSTVAFHFSNCKDYNTCTSQ